MEPQLLDIKYPMEHQLLDIKYPMEPQLLDIKWKAKITTLLEQFQKSNKKLLETGVKIHKHDMHIHDHSLSYLDTGI